jgi:LytS/YehU family sensor histidine kinase
VIPLEEELALVEAYVGIERERHPRISYCTEIAAGTRTDVVPPLLLQTLVENAIRHGVARHPAGGRVVVRALRSGSSLALEVDDSGSGTPVALPLAPGLGLRNTMERLETLYQDRASVSWSASMLGGLLVRVVLPADRAGQ